MPPKQLLNDAFTGGILWVDHKDFHHQGVCSPSLASLSGAVPRWATGARQVVDTGAPLFARAAGVGATRRKRRERDRRRP